MIRILVTTCLVCLSFNALARRSSGFPDPDPPQYDLTKTIDFERQGDYLLGPTGARGWMHLRNLMTKQARQILVTAVAEGSPADGLLQVGDIILGIGGKAFDDDARRLIGRAIHQAEASDGELRLDLWRPSSELPRTGTKTTVTIQLPVLGPEADSAPFACQKSATVYENALKALAAEKSMGKLGALAFLATGDAEHVARVGDYLRQQRWASPEYKIDVDRGGKMTWSCGFGLLIMCEYYLLTNDDYVLPAIRENAIKASMGQSRSGTWGHGFALPRNNNGKRHGDLAGYGALNLPSLQLLNGLLLARKCGVDHPEVDQAIDRALTFFRQFAGHGSISYGQHRPSFEHYAAGKNALGANGKNGLAAMAFALAGDSDSASFFSRLCASSHDTYEYGHGGNSFTVFWRSLGAAVGGPDNVAAFRRELRWYNTLTRMHDGSFAIQPLGGFYGGPTLNPTAAQVLALSLPRKTLVITGRDDLARIPLAPAETTAAVSAGQWRNADYDQLDSDTLLTSLDSFSPSAREWLARALGERTDFPISALETMLAATDPNRRAGAAAALGYQGARARPAIETLLNLLNDDAAPVRVAAAYALAKIGAETEGVLEAMLAAALAIKEEEPIQPTIQALAYAIGYQQSYTAPLYFDGLLATAAAHGDPLEGVDRKVLYAAVRKFADNNNGRVRSTGVAALDYYSRADIARNAQLLVDLIDQSPHGHVMFRDAGRAVAISALARHKITDGIDYAIDRLDFGHWGAVMRFPHRFEVLAEYGGHAKHQLATLKHLRWRVPNGYNREKLEEAITAIENASPASGDSLLELVESQLRRDTPTTKSRSLIVNACRELKQEYADDGFWQAAILRQLARHDKLKTEDLIAAFGHRNPLTRQVAVELAPDNLGWFGKRKLLKRLGNDKVTARERACIMALLPAWDKADRLTDYLNSPDDAIRAAALAVVAPDWPMARLFATLADAPGPATEAIVLNCIRQHPDYALEVISAAFADADEAMQLRLLPLIGEQPDAAATAFLLPIIQNKSRPLQEAAMTSLAARDDAALDAQLLELVTTAKGAKQYGQLLLRRLTAGKLTEEREKQAWKWLLATTDAGTARRVIGEIPWAFPPEVAVDNLMVYARKTEKQHRDLRKRAIAAIRYLAERLDPEVPPRVAAALAEIEATP